MELIERDEFLGLLQTKFQDISQGEGHCIFVSGEAGIGKTSLVKAFREKIKVNVLFTRAPSMHCLLHPRFHPCMISGGR